MNHSLTVDLPEGLRLVQDKWIQAQRKEQDIIYAKEFGPAFALLFAQLPLQGTFEAYPQFKVKALISILGLSWQPVALMAAWARPEHFLILGTRDSLRLEVGTESALSVITRISGIPKENIIIRQVGNNSELEIYREIKSFVKQYGLKPHEITIDPTGGKKSMSASASLDGFLIGAWIVYVDYAQYHPEKRIPIAGTEYPRLLSNPLDVFGELEFGEIKEAFCRGNYEEALHLSETLASRLYEPREAEGMALLAKAYRAWNNFAFAEAWEALEGLKVHMEKFSRRGNWEWSYDLLPKIYR